MKIIVLSFFCFFCPFKSFSCLLHILSFSLLFLCSFSLFFFFSSFISSSISFCFLSVLSFIYILLSLSVELPLLYSSYLFYLLYIVAYLVLRLSEGHWWSAQAYDRVSEFSYRLFFDAYFLYITEGAADDRRGIEGRIHMLYLGDLWPLEIG